MSNCADIGGSCPSLVLPRRAVLRMGFVAGIGPGNLAYAAQRGSRSTDVDLLNAALALEHQVIAAYDVGTGLLKGEPRDLAKHFQSQHRAHRDFLVGEIRKLGGKPVVALDSYKFEGKNDAPLELKTAEDILVFALSLEAGAASAYLGWLPQLASKPLLATIAGIACDESQHAAAIRLLLRQQPAPEAIVR
ncbi:MAG: ferritin-like domain-containing protein [Acidobacteriota bacterium]